MKKEVLISQDYKNGTSNLFLDDAMNIFMWPGLRIYRQKGLNLAFSFVLGESEFFISYKSLIQ